MLAVELVRGQLPRVGDVRWERPSIDTSTAHVTTRSAPQRCVVVEVNQAHLWYTVRFANGLRESYKLPKPQKGG